MRFSKRDLGLCAAFAFIACASVPKPTEQISQSEAAMRSAQELGAAQVPQAALEMQLAQEELDKCKLLMKDDKNEEAAQMAMRSRADAELAVALTHRSLARGEARGAEEHLKAVQEKVQ
jgi:hypothetical protein